MKNTKNILKTKPIKIWEFREYPKGSLLENGIVLNETGIFIYKLCNGRRTVREIVKKILEEYEVDQRKAEADTVRCIKELLTTGSIKLK